jgi:hypothetical protein
MTARFDRAWAKASRANLAGAVGWLMALLASQSASAGLPRPGQRGIRAVRLDASAFETADGHRLREAARQSRDRSSFLAPRAGFEPATIRLTVECSTAELPRNRRNNRSQAGCV